MGIHQIKMPPSIVLGGGAPSSVNPPCSYVTGSSITESPGPSSSAAGEPVARMPPQDRTMGNSPPPFRTGPSPIFSHTERLTASRLRREPPQHPDEPVDLIFRVVWGETGPHEAAGSVKAELAGERRGGEVGGGVK